MDGRTDDDDMVVEEAQRLPLPPPLTPTWITARIDLPSGAHM